MDDIDLIKKAIAGYLPNNNRSQIIEKNTNQILLDAYNANPSSMYAAISHFINYHKTNRVLILGDMFELGEATRKEHKYIIDFMKDKEETICFFVGQYFYACKIELDNFYFFESVADLKSYLNLHPIQNKSLLIKGSRGIALEQILESL